MPLVHDAIPCCHHVLPRPLECSSTALRGQHACLELTAVCLQAGVLVAGGIIAVGGVAIAAAGVESVLELLGVLGIFQFGVQRLLYAQDRERTANDLRLAPRTPSSLTAAPCQKSTHAAESHAGCVSCVGLACAARCSMLSSAGQSSLHVLFAQLRTGLTGAER